MRGGRRYHAILAGRLGLDGSEATLDRVGQDFGLTRERIRQICKKILGRLQTQPIGKAVQAVVNAVLDERGFVTTDELLELVPWLGASLSPRALELVLHDIYPACSRAYEDLGLISRVPRTQLEAVLQSWDLKVAELPRRVVFSSALDVTAREVAEAHGLPAVAATLVRTARTRIANQHQTFTAFVGEFVADCTEPFSIADLVEAGAEAGFNVSEGQARNTVSLISGVYPLGHAMFATFGQTFGTTSPLLESIAVRLRDIVHSSPSRQWHADELLTIVSRDFGFAGAEAIRDTHHLAVLLRERTQLTYLGRLVFVAESESRRLELVPLARKVLELAGTPLQKATLLQRVREQRGFTEGSAQVIFDALIEVSPGIWGLPERDVPLSAVEVELVCEDVWALLRHGELVPVREIRRRLIALGSPEVEKVEATLLRSLLRRDPRFWCSGSEGIMLADAHEYDLGWTPGENIA